MTDDSATGFKGSGTSSGIQSAAPPGHGLRRAATTDESWSQQFRRFPTTTASSPGTGTGATTPSAGGGPVDASFEGLRRRGSNFSDYNLNEARRSLHDDLLNPRPKEDGDLGMHEPSSFSSLPLAFALLPAVGGIFFKNGSGVVTDIMLLGLASIFLHWSVTQPW